jgi:transposase
MFIQKITKKVGDKVYVSYLLMENYREGNKVKHRIISNISRWPEKLIFQFEDLLKGKTITSLEDLNYTQGKSCGGIIVVKEIAKRLGIIKALGNDKDGQLALLQITGRIFTQGSRLHLAESWSKNHAVSEVLNIEKFDEDDLYANLDWLAENQTEIEKIIFKNRCKGSINEIFLYDVTSSYFEGTKNELSGFGYDRDGKKGKKQIVIGLLCDKEGYPVSVEVFEGNTNDTKTVSNQLKKLKKEFGVERVVFIGDKGMIKQQQIDTITSDDYKWNYITTITKAQIETLLNNNIIQLSMFDDELTEVIDNDIRYILRRNPIRADEINKTRISKIKKIEEKIQLKNQYLREHPRAKVSTALKEILKLIKRLKADKFINCCSEGRTLYMDMAKEDELKEITKLDGCYVIKTDVPKETIDKEIIHKRYKDLALVESAFKTEKTTLEEIRPIFVRKKRRTRGHVFVCMLAYMIIKYIVDATETLAYTKKHIFASLDAIQYIKYNFEKKAVKILPAELLEHQMKLLEQLNIKLPRYL